jgi:hypothetical protein
MTVRGSEQECWLSSNSAKTPTTYTEPIETEFSRMNLQGTPLLQNVSAKLSGNGDSASVITTPHTDGLHSNERQNLKKTLLYKLIAYIEEDCLIEEKLSNTSIYNLSYALRICRLLSQIRFRIKIFRTHEFAPYELSEIQSDVEYFLKASDQLENIIGQINGGLLADIEATNP